MTKSDYEGLSSGPSGICVQVCLRVQQKNTVEIFCSHPNFARAICLDDNLHQSMSFDFPKGKKSSILLGWNNLRKIYVTYRVTGVHPLARVILPHPLAHAKPNQFLLASASVRRFDCKE